VEPTFDNLTLTIWSKAKVKGNFLINKTENQNEQKQQKRPSAVFRDAAIAQVRLKKEFLNKDQSKHEDWFPLYMAKKQKESVR